MENKEIENFDFENQKKKLQSLIIEYQDKIKDYQYWRDHYAILKHQFENKRVMSFQKRIPKHIVTHFQIENDRFEKMIRTEIAQTIAEELVKSNLIEILIVEKAEDNEFEISTNFQFLP
jgi:hypothetical protein